MRAAALKHTVVSRSRAKTRGSRYTQRPAAARPKSATEMAKNAKWYHMTTESTRVSETSRSRIEAVMANSPRATPGAGRSDPVTDEGRAGRDAKEFSGERANKRMPARGPARGA